MKDYTLHLGIGGTTYSILGLPLAEWAAISTICYMVYRIIIDIIERRKNKCD